MRPYKTCIRLDAAKLCSHSVKRTLKNAALKRENADQDEEQTAFHKTSATPCRFDACMTHPGRPSPFTEECSSRSPAGRPVPKGLNLFPHLRRLAPGPIHPLFSRVGPCRNRIVGIVVFPTVERVGQPANILACVKVWGRSLIAPR
jgi:hypothetical protein